LGGIQADLVPGHWRRPAAVVFEHLEEVALDGRPMAAFGQSPAAYFWRPAVD
jgi:hypothetical protein